MLARVSIGWRWLANHLNTIIDEVNLNAPIGSASITADQSPNGTVLRVAQQNDQQTQQPGGSAPQPQPVVWHNVGWVTVTIVDPVSCAQSSLTVLAQKPGGQVTIS